VVNVCFGSAVQLSVKIGAVCSGAVNVDRDYSAGGALIGSKFLPNDKKICYWSGPSFKPFHWLEFI